MGYFLRNAEHLPCLPWQPEFSMNCTCIRFISFKEDLILNICAMFGHFLVCSFREDVLVNCCRRTTHGNVRQTEHHSKGSYLHCLQTEQIKTSDDTQYRRKRVVINPKKSSVSPQNILFDHTPAPTPIRHV